MALTLACTAAPGPPAATSGPEDSLAVLATATAFLQSFDSLNWEGFTRHLSDSVDVFWPRADAAGRLAGRQAVEARFRVFFDRVRTSRPGPPYLHLAVRDLRVRVLDRVALVTFELADVPDTLGRRTLVLRREGTAWRLIHLHASNLPLSR